MTMSRLAGAMPDKNPRIKSPRVELILIAGLLFAFGFSRMFRKWLFSDLDGIFGDQGDARVLIALLEHWYRILSGD